MIQRGKAKTRIKKATALLTAGTLLFCVSTEGWAQSNFWRDRRVARDRRNAVVAAPPSRLFSDMAPAVGASVIVSRSPDDAAVREDPLLRPLRGSPLLSALPLSCATVRDVSIPPGPLTRLVVHIQDVHGQRQAQDSIAKSIAWIEADARRRGAGPCLVALEGAAGPFQTDFYRSFPLPDVLRKVSGAFYEKNILTGAEFAALTGPTAPELWGVEEPGLYRRHVAAVKAGFPREEALRRAVEDLGSRLARAKEAAYPPALKAWDDKFESRHSGRLSLGDYVRFLAGSAPPAGRPDAALFLKALDRERGMDFTKAESQRRALVEALAARLDKDALKGLMDRALDFRAGRMDYGEFHRTLAAAAARAGLSLDDFPSFAAYVRYVADVEKIDRAKLLEQIDSLEKDAAGRALLGASPEARRLHEASGDLYDVKKVLARTMTPTDWDRYASRRGEARRLPERLGARDGGFARDLSLFDEFYTAGVARNDVMVDNLLRKMDARRTGPSSSGEPRISVLVAGGFHTDGITRLLKDKGIAYVVLAPRFDKIEGGEYLDVFRNDKTPLARLFEGGKLSIVGELLSAEEPPVSGAKSRMTLALPAALAAAARLNVAHLIGPLKEAVEAWIAGSGLTVHAGTSGGHRAVDVIARNGAGEAVMHVRFTPTGVRGNSLGLEVEDVPVDTAGAGLDEKALAAVAKAADLLNARANGPLRAWFDRHWMAPLAVPPARVERRGRRPSRSLTFAVAMAAIAVMFVLANAAHPVAAVAGSLGGGASLPTPASIPEKVFELLFAGYLILVFSIVAMSLRKPLARLLTPGICRNLLPIALGAMSGMGMGFILMSFIEPHLLRGIGVSLAFPAAVFLFLTWISLRGRPPVRRVFSESPAAASSTTAFPLVRRRSPKRSPDAPGGTVDPAPSGLPASLSVFSRITPRDTVPSRALQWEVDHARMAPGSTLHLPVDRETRRDPATAARAAEREVEIREEEVVTAILRDVGRKVAETLGRMPAAETVEPVPARSLSAETAVADDEGSEASARLLRAVRAMTDERARLAAENDRLRERASERERDHRRAERNGRRMGVVAVLASLIVVALGLLLWIRPPPRAAAVSAPAEIVRDERGVAPSASAAADGPSDAVPAAAARKPAGDDRPLSVAPEPKPPVRAAFARPKKPAKPAVSAPPVQNEEPATDNPYIVDPPSREEPATDNPYIGDPPPPAVPDGGLDHGRNGAEPGLPDIDEPRTTPPSRLFPPPVIEGIRGRTMNGELLGDNAAHGGAPVAAAGAFGIVPGGPRVRRILIGSAAATLVVALFFLIPSSAVHAHWKALASALLTGGAVLAAIKGPWTGETLSGAEDPSSETGPSPDREGLDAHMEITDEGAAPNAGPFDFPGYSRVEEPAEDGGAFVTFKAEYVFPDTNELKRWPLAIAYVPKGWTPNPEERGKLAGLLATWRAEAWAPASERPAGSAYQDGVMRGYWVEDLSAALSPASPERPYEVMGDDLIKKYLERRRAPSAPSPVPASSATGSGLTISHDKITMRGGHIMMFFVGRRPLATVVFPDGWKEDHEAGENLRAWLHSLSKDPGTPEHGYWVRDVRGFDPRSAPVAMGEKEFHKVRGWFSSSRGFSPASAATTPRPFSTAVIAPKGFPEIREIVKLLTPSAAPVPSAGRAERPAAWKGVVGLASVLALAAAVYAVLSSRPKASETARPQSIPSAEAPGGGKEAEALRRLDAAPPAPPEAVPPAAPDREKPVKKAAAKPVPGGADDARDAGSAPVAPPAASRRAGDYDPNDRDPDDTWLLMVPKRDGAPAPPADEKDPAAPGWEGGGSFWKDPALRAYVAWSTSTLLGEFFLRVLPMLILGLSPSTVPLEAGRFLAGAAAAVGYPVAYYFGHWFENPAAMASRDVRVLTGMKAVAGAVTGAFVVSGVSPMAAPLLPLIQGQVVLISVFHFILNLWIDLREREAVDRLKAAVKGVTLQDVRALRDAVPAVEAGLLDRLSDVHATASAVADARAFQRANLGLGVASIRSFTRTFQELRLKRALLDPNDVPVFQAEPADLSSPDAPVLTALRGVASRPFMAGRRIEVLSEKLDEAGLSEGLRKAGFDPGRFVLRGKDQAAGFVAGSGRFTLRRGRLSDALYLERLRREDGSVTGVTVLTSAPKRWLSSPNIIPAAGLALRDLLDAVEALKRTLKDA